MRTVSEKVKSHFTIKGRVRDWETYIKNMDRPIHIVNCTDEWGQEFSIPVNDDFMKTLPIYSTLEITINVS